MAEQPKYLNRSEIAKRYSISRGLTYLWVEQKKFPAPDVSVGTYSRWLVSTVLDWEARNAALLTKRGVDIATLPQLAITAPSTEPLTDEEAATKSEEAGKLVISLALTEQTCVAAIFADAARIMLKALVEGRIISQDEQDEIEVNVASLTGHYLPSLANWRQLMDASEKPTKGE